MHLPRKLTSSLFHLKKKINRNAYFVFLETQMKQADFQSYHYDCSIMHHSIAAHCLKKRKVVT